MLAAPQGLLTPVTFWEGGRQGAREGGTGSGFTHLISIDRPEQIDAEVLKDAVVIGVEVVVLVVAMV